MSIPRKAKRDKNEPEIINTLIHAGASVERLSLPNVPDLLVGFRGNNYLMEVKSLNGSLKTDQATWHQAWHGQVIVVRSPYQALQVIGAID